MYPQFFGNQQQQPTQAGQGMFSRSWQQRPGGFMSQPGMMGNTSFMQRPMSMFSMFARPQPNFLSYLPLLMSRGMFGLGAQRQPAAVPGVGAPQQIPQSFTPPVAAQPTPLQTSSSGIQQAAQTFQQANPTPQLFTPTPPVQQQPQQQAPAAPAWSPAAWFADPNSAARRIAAQAWGNLPLEQQEKNYYDTYGFLIGDDPRYSNNRWSSDSSINGV